MKDQTESELGIMNGRPDQSDWLDLVTTTFERRNFPAIAKEHHMDEKTQTPAPFIPKATYGMIGLSGRITTPQYGVSAKSGKPYLRFSLCTHDGKGGVGFITCFVNDKYADILAPDLEKGQRVAVTGRVSFNIDHYETKTPHGDTVKVDKLGLTINADHVELGAKAANRGITVEKGPEAEEAAVAEAVMQD